MKQIVIVALAMLSWISAEASLLHEISVTMLATLGRSALAEYDWVDLFCGL